MSTRILTIIIVMTLISSFALAHRPSGMTFSFDDETKVLTVDVRHNVGNPGNHYVESLTISHAGRQMILQELTKQETSSGIMFQYRIPDAESGMELSIAAKCNRMGTLTEMFKLD